MMIFMYLYVMFGYFSNFIVIAKSEELTIDPKSIFVDPNLYRFCWIQLAPLESNIITGHNKATYEKIHFNVSLDEQLSNRTYCIERKDRVNSFIIPLKMTRNTVTSAIIKFTVIFSHPLGPSLDVLRFQTVPKGIYVKMGREFAGITEDIGLQCDVLLMTEIENERNFEVFEIKTQRKIFWPLKSGSEFSLYYTCTVQKFFYSSTLISVQSGYTPKYEYDSEIKPFIKMPFRRFITVVWKHPQISEIRYDIAIYEYKFGWPDSCIKIFRIFINALPTKNINPERYDSNCYKNVSIEDMGLTLDGGDHYISAILDMVSPLKLYSNYKLIIFWKKQNGDIKRNVIHFSPFPNENSGNINNKFFDHTSLKNEEIINEVSSLSQTVISSNNQNPYKDPNLQIPGFPIYFIVASISGNEKYTQTLKPSDTINVSKLYKLFKDYNIKKNFYPYFYALYTKRMDSSTDVEIVQLPFPQEGKIVIENVIFLPNDKEMYFTVSWNMSNSPSVTTPAMFGVQLTLESNNTCHTVYLLKCRTCNTIYMQDTIKSCTKKIEYWKSTCLLVKELDQYYDAVDSSISFTTNKLPPAEKFYAQIFSFNGDNINNSEKTISKFIEFTFWQKYGKMIVYLIIGLVVSILFVGLFLFCKWLCRDPEIKDTEDSNMYEKDEEV